MESASHAAVRGSATNVRKSIVTLVLHTVSDVLQGECLWGHRKDVLHFGVKRVSHLISEVRGCARSAMKLQ